MPCLSLCSAFGCTTCVLNMICCVRDGLHRQKEILRIIRSGFPNHQHTVENYRPDTVPVTAANSAVQNADSKPANMIASGRVCADGTAIEVRRLRPSDRQVSAPDLGRIPQGSMKIKSNLAVNGQVGTQQAPASVSTAGIEAANNGRRPRSARLLLPDWGPQPNRRRDQAGARRVQARSWSMSDAMPTANVADISNFGITEIDGHATGRDKGSETTVSIGNGVGNDLGLSIQHACPPKSPKRQESQPSEYQQMMPAQTIAATQQLIFQEGQSMVSSPHQQSTGDKRQNLQAQPPGSIATSVAAQAVLQGQIGGSADTTVEPSVAPVVATHQNDVLQHSTLEEITAPLSSWKASGSDGADTQPSSNRSAAQVDSRTIELCIADKMVTPVRRHSAIPSRPPSHLPISIPDGQNAKPKEEATARALGGPRMISHISKSDEPIRAVRGAVRPVAIGYSSRNGSLSQLTAGQEVAKAALRFRGALEAATMGMSVENEGGYISQRQLPLSEQDKVTRERVNNEEVLHELDVPTTGPARAKAVCIGIRPVTLGGNLPLPADSRHYQAGPTKVLFGHVRKNMILDKT